jgi:hypothetical protein
MRTKFSVGQVVYLASAADQAVYRVIVTEILINSVRAGAGGPHRYDMDGFSVRYRLSGRIVPESDPCLHEHYVEAFGAIELAAGRVGG